MPLPRISASAHTELDNVIRGLTIDEFSAYFVGLKPPTQITHPAQAAAYARIADRWSQPWPFRRRNRALEVLADIYRNEARLLGN